MHQRGVALLLLMMLLLSSSAFYLASEHKRSVSKQDATLQSLLAAKQALLAYAVNYADNYGHNTRGGTGRLPCPALERFSRPALNCSPNAIGYLPSVWTRDGKRMEIDYLERFLDQDIWLAIAADHRYNPSYNRLNSISGGGLLSVDSLQDVIAVLIAPGTATDTQNRSDAAGLNLSNRVTAYLEGDNADGDAAFTLTESNDLLVPIRRSELIPLMERRTLGFAKQWLIEYKALNGFYPYAATLGASGQCEQGLLNGLLASEVGNCSEQSLSDMDFSNLPNNRVLRQTWFYRYGWPSLIYYVVDVSCSPVNGLTDCDGVDDPERQLRVNGEPVEVLLISVGEPIETTLAGGLQVRTSTLPENYLDSADLLSSDKHFGMPRLSSESNDQLVFIE